jgi:ABC-type nitrate/sulfonate/bicarbonate transport system substrate-binding protein
LKNCDITEVPVSGGGAKEVLSGSVDAAVIFSYEEPAQLQSKGQELNLISASQYFKLYSLSIITNEETAAKKKDLVASFVKVTEKSIKYALLHPDEGKQAFLRTAPEADLAYENLKFDLFSKLLAADDPSGNSIGQGTKEGWLKSVKLLRELGIVKSDVDPAGKFLEAK